MEGIRGDDCEKCGVHRFYASKKTKGQSRSKLCNSCCQKFPKPNRRLRPFEAQYNAAKSRARYDWNISYNEWLALSKIDKCHYCDAPIRWSEYSGAGGKKRTNASNLDRIDCNGVYDIDNVVVCCTRCNYGKGTHFSYEEWVEIGKVIKKFKHRKYSVTPMARRKDKKSLG